MSPVELGFIGCDPTAAVLARGLGERVLCADTDGARAAALVAAVGADALPSYAAVAERADIVILCHGRPDLARTAAAVGTHARIVVSTVADTPLEVVRHAYPGRPVYRIAVNSAAQIRRGVTVLAKGPAQPEDHVLQLLLERLGSVITVDDALVDTAAAVLDGVETDCIDAVATQAGGMNGRISLDALEGFLAG